MEGQFSYQDFDLLIEPGPAGSYRARVLRSPAGECAPVQFTLPFSELELENLVLKVSRGRRTRGPGRPENAPLKDFGGKLYGAVFQDELREALQRSLTLTRAKQAGMRLRLRLADTRSWPACRGSSSTTRGTTGSWPNHAARRWCATLHLPDPPQPLSVQGPLRLLVMISSPSDYPALDTEQEWSLLTGALAEQQAEGRVIIERLAEDPVPHQSQTRPKVPSFTHCPFRAYLVCPRAGFSRRGGAVTCGAAATRPGRRRRRRCPGTVGPVRGSGRTRW